MRVTFALFFLFNLVWSIFGFGFPPPTENTKKKPALILRDSYGRAISDSRDYDSGKTFGLSDFVFGSFFNLEADKKYHLSIMRDGKEISNLCLRSDKIGVISTCALWWNLGFNYNTSDGQKGIDPDFANHTYNLSMKDDNNNPVLETKIPVSNSTGKAYIYTCDKDGNPKNTFIRNKDDVYLKCGNLKAIVKDNNDNRIEQDTQDKNLYIYVVKDRWSWRIGDKLDGKDFLKQKYVESLNGVTLESPHMIWPNDDIEVGSYDIIVSCRNMGILFPSDLICSNYGVGFKVIDPQVEDKAKKDIIQELTCQAPPHILMFGNLDQPHRAIYKDYFSPIEEIWVAVETLNPTPAQREAQKVRIYIINHNNNKEWQDGEPLQDDSGGYEEVLLQPESAHAIFTRAWCKPEIREQGYDVVIDFKNSKGEFGTYDKGLDILDNGVKIEEGKKVKGKHMVNDKDVEHGGFYVPKQWVCLESVTLNHTRDAICSDAINIKFENPTDRIREWVRGKREFPAAYVKNSRITVHPTFLSSEDVGAAKFEAHTGSGSLSDIIEAYTDFYENSNKKPDNSTYQLPYNVTSYKESNLGFLLQVRQSTPSRIQSFYQQWDWYLKGTHYPYDEAIHIGSTINKIYIVLSAPQYPWTLEGDTAPWSNILDLCCQVAYGEFESETAAKKITQFLYQEVGGKYRENAGYSDPDSAFSDFQLKTFFNSIPNVGGVNCYDMGKALVTFGNVLGCNLTLRYCSTFGNLNCIKPVGSDWDCNMYFDNHAFATISDNVFDASLKADSRGNQGPPPYRAAWMINIPWLQYKEIVANKLKDLDKMVTDYLEENKPVEDVRKTFESLVKKIAGNQPPYPQVAIFKIKE